MPYKTNADLPRSIQLLPPEAQDVYRIAYDNAVAASEGKPDARAWDAVKLGWARGSDGQWVRK